MNQGDGAQCDHRHDSVKMQPFHKERCWELRMSVADDAVSS